MNHIEFNALLEQWKSDVRMTIAGLCEVSGYSKYEIRRARCGKFDAAIPDLVQSMSVVEKKGLFRKQPLRKKNAGGVGKGQYMVARSCKACGGRIRIIESKECVICADAREKRAKRKARYAAKREMAA